MTHLRDFYSGEGMYPSSTSCFAPGSRRSPLCPSASIPTVPDCADDDPYSYRLSMVLPAYAGRFQDMDFRRLSRIACGRRPGPPPAQDLLVNGADMAAIESAYRD